MRVHAPSLAARLEDYHIVGEPQFPEPGLVRPLQRTANEAREHFFFMLHLAAVLVKAKVQHIELACTSNGAAVHVFFSRVFLSIVPSILAACFSFVHLSQRAIGCVVSYLVAVLAHLDVFSKYFVSEMPSAVRRRLRLAVVEF